MQRSEAEKDRAQGQQMGERAGHHSPNKPDLDKETSAEESAGKEGFQTHT